MSIGHNSMGLGRWVAIAVDAWDHPLVGAKQPVRPADPSRGSASRFEAWFWLIQQAQFKDTVVYNKGHRMRLVRGDLMASHGYLAGEWNWTIDTVREWLGKLIEAGMIARRDEPVMLDSSVPKLQVKLQSHAGAITRNSPNQLTKRRSNLIQVLSVCNYELYQHSPYGDYDELHQQDSQANPKPTPSQPQANPNNLTKIQGYTKEDSYVDLDQSEVEEIRVSSPEVESAKTALRHDAAEAARLWNETAGACGLPILARGSLSERRARELKARIREFGLDGWRKALGMIEQSEFLTGGTGGRNWKATFDWLIKASNFLKVIEGSYGNGRDTAPPGNWLEQYPLDHYRRFPAKVWEPLIAQMGSRWDSSKVGPHWSDREGCRISEEVQRELRLRERFPAASGLSRGV